jgi:hypothetical protein
MKGKNVLMVRGKAATCATKTAIACFALILAGCRRASEQRKESRPAGVRRSTTIEVSVQLFICTAASIAWWWRSLASTLQLAASRDAYTYILLIVPVSLALIYIENRPIPGRNEVRAMGRRNSAGCSSAAAVLNRAEPGASLRPSEPRTLSCWPISCRRGNLVMVKFQFPQGC